MKRKNFPNAELYQCETWELMERRWTKLEKDFLNKNGLFDISKLPDIYDCIKYDLLHNKSTMQCENAEELYTYAKNMADIVIPQVNKQFYSKLNLMWLACHKKGYLICVEFSNFRNTT